MPKAKVTRKWLNQNYKCISVSYCTLQNLLRYESPLYYTCGVYGWNFDAYILDGICITTGYRGMIDNFQNNNTYELQRKYDKIAAAIHNNPNLSSNGQYAKIKYLQKKYITEVKGR
jgi:hypothetical protein